MVQNLRSTIHLVFHVEHRKLHEVASAGLKLPGGWGGGRVEGNWISRAVISHGTGWQPGDAGIEKAVMKPQRCQNFSRHESSEVHSRHARCDCAQCGKTNVAVFVDRARPRFAGEARSALLAAIASNLRLKKVVVVDPDIDVQSSEQVEWATAFRMQLKDVLIVDKVPPGPFDPSVDASVPTEKRTGSAIGIDATFPFGATVESAADVPAGQACGPAVAEHGHEFFEVASVPGWQEYNFSELLNRPAAKSQAGVKS